jgi:hypothetical protein
VSGLQDQALIFFVAWSILITIGFFHMLLSGKLLLAIRGCIHWFVSLRHSQPSPATNRFVQYQASPLPYETGIRICNRCQRSFRLNILLSNFNKEIKVAYCDACGYTACEHCYMLPWEEFRLTSCPRCGQRMWRLEGMLPV